MKEYASQLEAAGITCTSRWLDEAETEKGLPKSATKNLEVSVIDIEDVHTADALVLFSEDPEIGIPRGGRNVEFGYALGKSKPVLVVGPYENIFHYLPTVSHYVTWGHALYKLLRWQNEIKEANG